MVACGVDSENMLAGIEPGTVLGKPDSMETLLEASWVAVSVSCTALLGGKTDVLGTYAVDTG